MPSEKGSELEMSRFHRLLFLRSVPAYSELPPEDLVPIAAQTRELRFTDGSHILREGEPVSRVHFIVEGEVQVRRGGVEVRHLSARDVVGGVAALAEDPKGYDAIAVGEVTTLAVEADEMEEMLEDNFALLRIVLRSQAREIVAARASLGESAGFAPPSDVDPEWSNVESLDLVERLAFLRRTLAFARGRIEAIADLVTALEELHLPEGEVLFEEEESPDEYFLVVRGLVRCESKATGQRFTLGPYDTVGAIDAAAEQPRWYGAVTASDFFAFRVRVETFFDVLEDHFDVALAFLRVMASGLLGLYDQKAGIGKPVGAVDDGAHGRGRSAFAVGDQGDDGAGGRT